MSFPKNWKIEQEKDREKEQVGGMPAKLNEKKGDRDLDREINNKGDIFFLLQEQFCSCGEKIRNASDHQYKVKMSGSEKKSEREHVRH